MAILLVTNAQSHRRFRITELLHLIKRERKVQKLD